MNRAEEVINKAVDELLLSQEATPTEVVVALSKNLDALFKAARHQGGTE